MPTHLLTATGDYTGVSANHVLVYTAGSNGGFVQRLRFQAEGGNTASVARIYINNGSTHTSAGNNAFHGQISLPTISATNTAATTELDYPMNFGLNPNHQIWVGLGTTVAAGWMCTAIGGSY
jgi:hypothetical protein